MISGSQWSLVRWLLYVLALLTRATASVAAALEGRSLNSGQEDAAVFVVDTFDVVKATNMTNCTAADWDRQTFFRGLECHISNIWNETDCPVAGACEPACARCIAWRRGVLPLARAAAALQLAGPRHAGSSGNNQPATIPCGSSMWSMGNWVPQQPPPVAPSPLLPPATSSELPVWQPTESFAASCPHGLLPQAAIYQCLRGRRVFLLGDSMIRPLLGRLVAYLRGIPRYIDHLFHHPGGYYLANGTHDAFVEGDMLPSLRAAERLRDPGRTPVPEDAWEPAASMQFQFYWAPQFKPYLLDGVAYPGLLQHFGILQGADILIAGPMYHDMGNYEHYPDLLTQLFQQQHATTGRRVSAFFWVASFPRPTDRLEDYWPRNLRMRAFVEALNDASLAGLAFAPVRSFFVDTELLAFMAPFQRAEHHHYQCNKHGSFPQRVSADLTGLDGALDCRDPFNLNLMHSMLKVACADSLSG